MCCCFTLLRLVSSYPSDVALFRIFVVSLHDHCRHYQGFHLNYTASRLPFAHIDTLLDVRDNGALSLVISGFCDRLICGELFDFSIVQFLAAIRGSS